MLVLFHFVFFCFHFAFGGIRPGWIVGTSGIVSLHSDLQGINLVVAYCTGGIFGAIQNSEKSDSHPADWVHLTNIVRRVKCSPRPFFQHPCSSVSTFYFIAKNHSIVKSCHALKNQLIPGLWLGTASTSIPRCFLYAAIRFRSLG